MACQLFEHDLSVDRELCPRHFTDADANGAGVRAAINNCRRLHKCSTKSRTSVGYTIEIWRQGDKYFGLMFGDSTPRAIGDGPVARLENAEFNPKTESLRFTTVIRRGLCPEVRFEGKLSNSKLEGTFSPIEEECPKYTAASERILLRKSRQLTSEAEEFRNFRNFAEWNAFADGLLR
ncbi:MAG: hypothetical protein IPK58_18025 [Acidobacteria bacterium]|nr:hypothetical protein [Acidobacteriota bacterium]